MFGKKFRGLMLVVMALVLLVALTACGNGGGKAIRVADFVSAEFDGVDGKGRVYFSVDEEKFAEELLEKYEKKLEKVLDEYDVDVDTDDYAEAIAGFFDVDTDAENIKNGDIIKFEIEADGEISGLEEFGIKFDLSSGEAIASGLKQVETVDVFENMDVSFGGISPNLYMILVEKDADKYPFGVSYEPTEFKDSYKIGDTVEIEAVYNEDAVSESGYAVLKDKTTITIEETMADYYVTAASQLQNINSAEIRAEADKLANESFTTENYFMTIEGTSLGLGNAESITEISYYKSYIASSEDPKLNASLGVKANNFICMVYKFKVNNASDAFVTEETYNDYAYAYIFLPNVSVKNGSLNYDLYYLGCGDGAYKDEAALKNYLSEYNYTCEEFNF